MRSAASNAVQNPRNGPKENAKKMRSRAVTPDAWNTCVQLSSIQAQLSGVSSQCMGWPEVALVWQKRV